jgi:hypothetical protein
MSPNERRRKSAHTAIKDELGAESWKSSGFSPPLGLQRYMTRQLSVITVSKTPTKQHYHCRTNDQIYNYELFQTIVDNERPEHVRIE